MKKILNLISLLVLSFLIASCAPKNTVSNPDLYGVWQVKEIKDVEEKQKEVDAALRVDDYIYISDDDYIIGNDVIKDAKTKYRKVSLEDYLFFNYKIELNDTGGLDADVYSIYEDDSFRYDLIISEDKMMIKLGKYLYTLIKTDKALDEVHMKELVALVDSTEGDASEAVDENIGFLLGLREDKDGASTYKTIYMQPYKGEAYELDYLLVPRRDGFARIECAKIEKDGIYQEDFLVINDHVNTFESLVLYDGQNEKALDRMRKILFVGNDYFSYEIVSKLRDNGDIGIYFLDNYSQNNKASLRELIDESETDNTKTYKMDEFKNSLNDVRNLTVVRNNGYWILKQRDHDMKYPGLYKDSYVMKKPNKNLVRFDELYFNYETLKEKFPKLKDAFSAPNKSMVMIYKDKTLAAHAVYRDEIMDEIFSIDLNSNIIMNEWALGQYGDMWKEKFISLGAKKIK